MAKIDIIKDLRQRHIEKWEEEYFRFSAVEDGEKRGQMKEYGDVIRAALAADMLVSNAPIDVGDMPLKEVVALARKINATYLEAVTIDPNS